MATTMKPCEKCPTSGDCPRCGYPGAVRMYLRDHPLCPCGAQTKVTRDIEPPMSTNPGRTTWFVECSRLSALVMLGALVRADHTMVLVTDRL